MLKKINTLFFLLLFALMPFDIYAQQQSESVNKELRQVINDYVEKGQFEGSVLVAQNSDTLLADGWGYANREWQMPNSITTRFRLGSITKMFTATLIMKLVQEGRVSLDNPVADYIEGLPGDRGKDITVRHLLTHTSGLQEFYRIPGFKRLWLYTPPSPEELVKIVSGYPLEFEPGARYAYRNIGFIALGIIIEKITGQSYESALTQHIFQPAGMIHSGLEQEGEIIPQRADGYARIKEGWRKGDHLNPGILSAAGGIYSTAMDMYRFSKAIDSNLLLKPEILEQMLTPQIKESQDKDDHRYYAYGWHIDKLANVAPDSLIKITEHGGDVTSFETLFTRIPHLNAVIVILYNYGETDQDAIRDDLIRVLVKHNENI